MNRFGRIGQIFWSAEEHRLRSLWRITMHGGLVVIFTSILTMGFLFLALAVDAVLGVNLGQRLLAIETIEAQQIPLVLWVFVSLATFLGILLATLLAGRFIDERRWGDFGLQLSKEWWVDFAFGLVLGAFLMGFIFLFGWATGNVRIIGVFQPIGESITFLTGFVQSLIFFIFVGLYEELFTRGYHLVNLSEGLNLGFLGKRRAIYLAVLITSLAFGSFHVFNPNASWVSTLNIALVGVIFSLGMIFTKRLAIPIGLHIAWNFFQGNVFGFPVSGMRNGATLIATETLGPDWLMGGSFGPEAGLVGVGAMVLGGALILLWIRRRGALALQTDLANYFPMEQKKSV